MEKQSDKAMASLEKAGIALLLQEPFFAHLLAGLNRQVSEDEEATTLLFRRGSLELRVEADHWNNQLHTPPQRIGSLKHELLHLLMRHPLRASKFENAFLFNLAADLVAQRFLSDEQQLFTDLNQLVPLQKMASVEDYYLALSQILDADPDHRLLQAIKTTATQRFAGHRWWHLPRNTAENELLEFAIQRWIAAALKRISPAERLRIDERLQPWLELTSLSGRNLLQWRKVIRLFVASSSRTKVKNTIRRPSKRYGTTPGIQIRRQHRLIVATDVSGSISATESARFFKEIDFLYRTGTEILLVECDEHIRSISEYSGTIPTHRQWHGGTDFTPVLQLANERPDYDGLLYFTDGKGPIPKIACRMPILWIITNEGVSSNATEYQQLPGLKVKMPVIEQDKRNREKIVS